MLRPIDIQNKEFEKKLKGYNCDEVDDFLDVVIRKEKCRNRGECNYQ